MSRRYYMVLTRFGDDQMTYIMLLYDQQKAEALCKFLNDGVYFETTVIVESGMEIELNNLPLQ